MASTLLANNGGARKLERLHSQHLQNGSSLDAAVTSTLSRSDDAFCEPIALASWSPEAATESPPLRRRFTRDVLFDKSFYRTRCFFVGGDWLEQPLLSLRIYDNRGRNQLH